MNGSWRVLMDARLYLVVLTMWMSCLAVVDHWFASAVETSFRGDDLTRAAEGIHLPPGAPRELRDAPLQVAEAAGHYYDVCGALGDALARTRRKTRWRNTAFAGFGVVGCLASFIPAARFRYNRKGA